MIVVEEIDERHQTVKGWDRAGNRGFAKLGELGVGWRDGAIEKPAHGHFELAPIVQGHSHG